MSDHTCSGCGRDISHRFATARWCSGACRKAAGEGGTVSLSAAVYRDVKAYAAAHGTTMTAVTEAALREHMAKGAK